jgi:hypothetical protein
MSSTPFDMYFNIVQTLLIYLFCIGTFLLLKNQMKEIDMRSLLSSVKKYLRGNENVIRDIYETRDIFLNEWFCKV